MVYYHALVIVINEVWKCNSDQKAPGRKSGIGMSGQPWLEKGGPIGDAT